MKTVAEFMAEELAEAGVERVYGLPGGENVEILDAIRRRGLDFALVKNESSAAYMAATEARLTGGIGVALTTLGPGAANSYAGIAHAWLDRAPVLLLSAASDPALLGRHSHQVLDLGAVFQPVTKLSAAIRATTAAETMRRALRLMRQGRPGPAHLSIHNDVALQAMPARAQPPALPNSRKVASAEIDRLRQLLAGKRRPLIVVGLGLEPDRPYSQLRQLAEALNAPLIDTPKSKGALPAAHPLFAGTIGLTREDPAYALLDESDCVIAIGFDVVELVKPWEYQKPLAWLANWGNRDPRIDCALECLGNLGEILEALGSPPAATDPAWGRARVRRFRDSLARRPLPVPAEDRLLPQDFLASLRARAPDEIILCTDVGSHKIFAALEWQAALPNRYFVSNGLSAMGFGLSSAIAAAMATGEPTVCVTGDAGLAMVLGELGLLVERRLPVIVALMNDSALDLIRSAQVKRDRPAFGTEFANPDYEHIARAYGMAYRRVASRRACDAAIQAGLTARAPMLLDVMIDPIGYPTSP